MAGLLPRRNTAYASPKRATTLAELKAKAVSTPDELTQDEAMIVHHPEGVRFEAFEKAGEQEILERLERLEQRRVNPSPMEMLQDNAQRHLNIAAGEEEKMALWNARNRWVAIDYARLDASLRI